MSIDWSKPETLRFRDFDAKIIEVLVPKNEESLKTKYPVTVFSTFKGGDVGMDTFTLDGIYDLGLDNDFAKDIIQTKKAPLSFWEIVKLISDNEGLNVLGEDTPEYICEIDIDNQTFKVGIVNYTVEQLYSNFAYTLDGMTWHKFEKDEE